MTKHTAKTNTPKTAIKAVASKAVASKAVAPKAAAPVVKKLAVAAATVIASAAPAPAAKKVAPVAKTEIKRSGVGAFVKAELLKGVTDEEILKAVTAKFPEARTTKACIAWYRCQMRKAGDLK